MKNLQRIIELNERRLIEIERLVSKANRNAKVKPRKVEKASGKYIVTGGRTRSGRVTVILELDK